MRERPILFSGPLVRAILAGTKTQTRRLVKPHPVPVGTLREIDEPGLGQTFVESGVLRTPARWGSRPAPCPYGDVGDRLWVRETWRVQTWSEGADVWIEYRADGGERRCEPPDFDVWLDRESDRIEREGATIVDGVYRMPEGRERAWRPSIFLERWASRLVLEVTSVRVERLQAITEEDARAEGVEPIAGGGHALYPSKHAARADLGARDAFASLWDAINGKRCPWSANPWVWVVGFRRIDA